MATEVLRRRFDVSEYYRMADAGILREDDRVELIEGEIFQMSPIGKRHAARVARVAKLFERLLGEVAVVWNQGPIRLDKYSELQPDITLLKPRPDFYEGQLPGPADVLLILEVSDSSSAFDQQVKVPAYARAGIAELWLELISEDRLEAYTNPANGVYGKVRQVRRGESLSLTAFPEVKIRAEDLLG